MPITLSGSASRRLRRCTTQEHPYLAPPASAALRRGTEIKNLSLWKVVCAAPKSSGFRWWTQAGDDAGPTLMIVVESFQGQGQAAAMTAHLAKAGQWLRCLPPARAGLLD